MSSKRGSLPFPPNFFFFFSSAFVDSSRRLFVQKSRLGHRTDRSPRLADILIDSITNVRRELKFFEDVASRYGLKLEEEEVSEGVRRYRELFFSVGEEIEGNKREMLDGLIVLWGTEKVFSLVHFPQYPSSPPS